MLLKNRKIRNFCMLMLTLMIGFVPRYADAANYNTTVEADRDKIQNILPGTTFDQNNIPSVGVEVCFKNGDTVYFENANKWNDIMIYIFDSNGNILNNWRGVAMEKTSDTINGNDIYKFTIQSDITTFNKLIFSGTDAYGNTLQTKDLSYIGNGLYFSINTTANDGKYDGTWYVYDKTSITNYINLVKKLGQYKDLLTEESYKSVTDEIENMNQIIAELKVPANFYTHNNTNLYISDYNELVYKVSTLINNLKVDTEELETLLEEAEAKDTTGWKEEEIETLDTTISEYKALLTELNNTTSLFSVTPATTASEITTQFDTVAETMGNIETLKSKIKEASSVVVEPETDENAGNLSNVTNPNTGDDIVTSIILLVASIVGMVISVVLYRRKVQSN